MGLLSLFPEGGSFLLGGCKPDSPRSRESVACGQTTSSSPFLGEDWWQRGLSSVHASNDSDPWDTAPMSKVLILVFQGCIAMCRHHWQMSCVHGFWKSHSGSHKVPC